MTQSQTPAGWYPEGDGERFWDGAQWTEQRRPRQTAPPPTYQQQYAQPGMYQQPVKTSHTARNILIVFAVLFVVFVGGCFAVLALAANKVSDTVNEATANNSEPGGPDNPLTIVEGKAFEVSGFNYQAGWSIGKDVSVAIDIQGLKVENNRGDRDSAIVEIKFMKGSEVVALSNCISEPITPGTTVTLSCLSTDTLPASYDKITINDSF